MSRLSLGSRLTLGQQVEEIQHKKEVVGDLISERVHVERKGFPNPPGVGDDHSDTKGLFPFNTSNTAPVLMMKDAILASASELNVFMGTTGELAARTIAAAAQTGIDFKGRIQTFFKAFVLPWDVKEASTWVNGQRVAKDWFVTQYMPCRWERTDIPALSATFRPRVRKGTSTTYRSEDRGKPWISSEGNAIGFDASTELSMSMNVYILKAKDAADTVSMLFKIERVREGENYKGEIDTTTTAIRVKEQDYSIQGLYHFLRFGAMHPVVFSLLPVSSPNARHVVASLNTIIEKIIPYSTELKRFVPQVKLANGHYDVSPADMLYFMTSEAPLIHSINKSTFTFPFAIAEYDKDGHTFMIWGETNKVVESTNGAACLTVLPLYPFIITQIFGPPFHFIPPFNPDTVVEEDALSRLYNKRQESAGLEPSMMTMELPRGVPRGVDLIGSITPGVADRIFALRRLDEADKMAIPNVPDFNGPVIPGQCVAQLDEYGNAPDYRDPSYFNQ